MTSPAHKSSQILLSQIGVCAPVGFIYKHDLIRLRVSGEVAHTGHHVVCILGAIIDVIHDVGDLRFADGLQTADLKEVG